MLVAITTRQACAAAAITRRAFAAATARRAGIICEQSHVPLDGITIEGLCRLVMMCVPCCPCVMVAHVDETENGDNEANQNARLRRVSEREGQIVQGCGR